MVTLLSFTVSTKSIEGTFTEPPNLAAIEAAITAAMGNGSEMCDLADRSAATTTPLLKNACPNAVAHFTGTAASIRAEVAVRLAALLASGKPVPVFQINFTVAGKPQTLLPVCDTQGCKLAPSPIVDAQKGKLKVQWDVTKTVPTNLQNLQAALSQGGTLAAAQAGFTPLSIEVGLRGSEVLVAQGKQSITLLPSSVKVTSTLTFPSDAKDTKNSPLKDVSVGSSTYANEGKSWWNVSVAAPLKAVKSVNYNANTLQPSTLDNKAAYAAFDVYVGKVDIVNPRFRLIPAVFGGPSFTGKFLDRWLVGVSIGFWFVEPFWGYSFLDTTVPKNAAMPTAGTTGRWTHAQTWGINIPIKNFYKLANNNSSKSTTSKSK